MTDQHSITPPPELVHQWVDTYFNGKISQSNFHLDLATRAAQWGSDQELKACCKWQELHLLAGINLSKKLRAARRPKPPSLKEQALAVLKEEPEDSKELIVFDTDQINIIRKALEQLDD